MLVPLVVVLLRPQPSIYHVLILQPFTVGQTFTQGNIAMRNSLFPSITLSYQPAEEVFPSIVCCKLIWQLSLPFRPLAFFVSGLHHQCTSRLPLLRKQNVWELGFGQWCTKIEHAMRPAKPVCRKVGKSPPSIKMSAGPHH